MFEPLKAFSYIFSHESEIVSLGEAGKDISHDMKPLRRTSMMVDWFVQLKEREQKQFRKIFPFAQTAWKGN